MLCRYSQFSLKKGYAMKMNKQRLSYSDRLHPLSVYQLCWFWGTEEKKNNLEKTSQMVSTPGSEPRLHLFDIWVLSRLRHPCQRGYMRTEATLFSSLFPRETSNQEEKFVSWAKDKALNCHANSTVCPYGSHSGKKQHKYSPGHNQIWIGNFLQCNWSRPQPKHWFDHERTKFDRNVLEEK